MAWEDHYAAVEEAYDSIAAEYDVKVGQHAVSRRARQQARTVIEGVTPEGGLLLDVGCYTGEEALVLARRGYRVVGTDLSTNMIEIATQKALRRNVNDRIQFEALKASDLGILVGRVGPFDTIYSVYGTLNLEPRLERVKRAIVKLLAPEGTLVVGLLNPTVLYELLVAPLLLKFHGYSKLSKRGVWMRTGLGDRVVETRLYGPREFANVMEPEFALERLQGVHFLYPPPRGTGGGGRWWLARVLDAWEAPLQSRYPFHSLGFFSLLVFRRGSHAAG